MIKVRLFVDIKKYNNINYGVIVITSHIGKSLYRNIFLKEEYNFLMILLCL